MSSKQPVDKTIFVSFRMTREQKMFFDAICPQRKGKFIREAIRKELKALHNVTLPDDANEWGGHRDRRED